MAMVIDIQLVAIDSSLNNTIRTQSVSQIDHIRPPSAGELAAFPTATSAVIVRELQGSTNRARILLTPTTVTALKSAIAS
jgi:hypothetical protein